VQGSIGRLLLCGLALVLLAASGAALAVESPAPSAPGAMPGQDICPAIAEGFELCANDLLSGNCAQFVAAADRLAQLYQIQVDDTPERVPMLLSTNWWGCGDAPLTQMKELLLQIGTPAAQAVLQQEPFARLAPPAPEGAPRRATPTIGPDCAIEQTPDARDACAADELASALKDYQRAMASCSARVAPLLRGEFESGERAWLAMLPAQCDAAGLEYQEPRLQAFARSQCRASAMRERTRGMLAAHPECRPAP
jgi:uncharacterized protein YecT (DUF1311 family)